MALLSAIGLCLPSVSTAEVLMEEYFEYNEGNLYNQGGWFRAGTQDAHPIQVTGTGMTFPGYQSEAKGHTARLKYSTASTNNQAEDLARCFDNYAIVNSGELFVSFLINVEEVKDDVYTFTFAGPGTAGMTDGKAISSDVGRIFILPGDAAGTFKVGMSKFSGTVSVKSGDLTLNTPHLVVLSYTFVDGNTNDIIKLWVNPDNTEEAPACLGEHSAGADANATRGIQGVYLRQGSTASKNNPTYTVDAIRAATTWAELFPKSSGEPDTPSQTKINVSSADVKFSNVFQGQTVTSTVNVKGENLTDNISVALDNSQVTADVTTISADEAMSAGGKNIVLTYKAGATPLSATMTLSTEGAEDVNVKISANPNPVTDVTMLGQLSRTTENDFTYYRYTGTSAVVTFVDTANKIVYLQDLSGAIAIDYSTAQLAKAPVMGDKLKNIYLMVYQKSFGVLYFMPILNSLGENNGTGTKTPTEVRVSDIKSDPESYLLKLVSLTDVSVSGSANWGTAAVDATSDGQAFKLRSFAGTDLVGSAMPSDITTVTGILTSASESSVILSVRGSSDVEEAPASLDAKLEYQIDNKEYQVVNTPVVLAKVTVKSSGVKSGSVWLGGTNRSMFSVDVEEIPAGKAETVITVTYNPTATGAHTAVLNLDMSPTELSQAISLSAKAYDPENPPVITVNTADLTDFQANVGETQQQTISYTASNLLDYGSVKVVQDVAAFQISTTMLMKTGTYNINVTFAPKSEGEFNAQLVFTADKAETVTIDLKGSTLGSPDEPTKEGDEFVLDTANALKSYKNDFENAGANYKPLSLEGWTNVAVEGTRAWWSKDVDGNRAAYVTAYDSNSSTDEPCEMLLVSPALDFKNADSRLLQFSIMGNLLTDGMNDLLEVVYIEPTDNDPYIEPINGLAIPASSDYNEEWVPYVIDLEGQNLADVFFIGFRFTSLRGRESTAQYYVDDFAWGQTDVPFIRVSNNWIESTTADGVNHKTDEVTVTGLSLTDNISLSLSGAHASHFELSHQTLPAEGGVFHLIFNGDEEGEYETFASLKSQGAPETLVYVHVTQDKSTAIALPYVDKDSTVSVYTLNGLAVCIDAPAAEALSKMQNYKGQILIVKSATKTYKIKVD